MMKIFVTNDDGVMADGINILAAQLASKGYEVLVIAPNVERSASGHAMTLDRPITLRDVDRRLLMGDYMAMACDGTPTDCVIAAFDIMRYKADLLVSGINRGPNIADDLTYSGTVCAAMEGVICEVPSIAVSLDCSDKDKEFHYETASDVVLSVIEWNAKNPMPVGVLYNINVPNVMTNELKGIKATRKGCRRYMDKIKEVRKPSGGKAWWIGGRIVDDIRIGTDVQAVSEGYASLTPVTMEMTEFGVLDECRKNGMEEFLSKKEA